MARSTFTLPDLVSHCPYPLRINPLCDTVTRNSEAWILTEAKYTPEKKKKFLDTVAGILTAYCYPDADAFHLQVSSDYLTWLFCFDDWSDEFDETDAYSLADCIMACLRDPDGFETDKTAGRLTKRYATQSFFFNFPPDPSGPRLFHKTITF